MMTVFFARQHPSQWRRTGHDVSVVCPDRDFRNWTWFDLHQPIRAEIVESVFNPPLKPGLFRHSLGR